jgi:hypothetical protein
MTLLVDVVNFNADASCLDSERWLRSLSGQTRSEFCQWLGLYVSRGKKVVLGLTGATVADLAAHNPEALGLIADHPELFETVARPFSHDVALIRSSDAFAMNVNLGARAARRHFQRPANFYLPPEFMLSNEQITLLSMAGLKGVLVNAERLTTEMRRRIPTEPYWVRGVGGSQLRCLPVTGALTRDYLHSLHEFDSSAWNGSLAACGDKIVISWRDGESPFLIPGGLEREAHWLDHETAVDRLLLSEPSFVYRANDALDAAHLRSYPVHSFQAWMKEFRMIGYLGRLQRLEHDVKHFSIVELALWLQAINSDVLSAVEKRSIKVRMRSGPGRDLDITFNILRSERGFEGEEYLRLLEHSRLGTYDNVHRFLEGNEPHAVKIRGRLEYLRQLCTQEKVGE